MDSCTYRGNVRNAPICEGSQYRILGKYIYIYMGERIKEIEVKKKFSRIKKIFSSIGQRFFIFFFLIGKRGEPFKELKLLQIKVLSVIA